MEIRYAARRASSGGAGKIVSSYAVSSPSGDREDGHRTRSHC